MTTHLKTLLLAGAMIAAASTSIAQAATGRTASDDQRITNEVVSTLANDSRMTGTGKIGVETDRGQVTLTGLVPTPGEAARAERDARSVDGVLDVQNLVRAEVGDDF